MTSSTSSGGDADQSAASASAPESTTATGAGISIVIRRASITALSDVIEKTGSRQRDCGSAMDIKSAPTPDRATSTRISGTPVSAFRQGVLDGDVVDADGSRGDLEGLIAARTIDGDSRSIERIALGNRGERRGERNGLSCNVAAVDDVAVIGVQKPVRQCSDRGGII
jgi:hypothetical protein